MTTAPNRTGRAWTIDHPGHRPLTTNRVADLQRFVWARHTKTVRRDWWLLARQHKVPRLGRAVVTVTPLHRDRRSPQDAAACAPEAKAAIDGLVDAQVLPDDNADHLALVVFTPPDVCGVDGLRLHIEELTP
jgi:hypothetical protein